MCCVLRCTVSLAVPSSRIRARVWIARRIRRSFLEMFMEVSDSEGSLLLAFLHGDLLARVAHTLASVRFGWTQITNLRRHLSNFLQLDALHDDLGRRRCVDRYA